MKKTLGMTISELRKKQGMTQLDLANLMGVTDKAVSKWERDLSCPDINSFPHLAQVLHVSVDELLQVKTQPQVKEKKKVNEIVNVALRGVALAMGVAVAVLSILGETDSKTAFIMLGIGLASLSVSALQGNGEK